MITDDNNSRFETFSFMNTLAIMETHTGEEAFIGVALDAPMSCKLNRNRVCPRILPRITEAKMIAIFLLLRLQLSLG